MTDSFVLKRHPEDPYTVYEIKNPERVRDARSIGHHTDGRQTVVSALAVPGTGTEHGFIAASLLTIQNNLAAETTFYLSYDDAIRLRDELTKALREYRKETR